MNAGPSEPNRNAKRDRGEGEDGPRQEKKKLRIGALMRSEIQNIIKTLDQEHAQRIRVNSKCCSSMPVQPNKRIDVAEAYSPPRMTREAAKLGLNPGFSWDL